MDIEIRKDRAMESKKYKALLETIKTSIDEMYYISDKWDAELEDEIELDVRECLRKGK